MVERQHQTFLRRAVAYFVDGVPFDLVQGLSGAFVGYLHSYYAGLAWGQFWGWALIAYRVLLHGFWGQTLGKKLFKVRVVALDGQPLSMKRALLREIVPIVLGLASLLYVILNLEAYEHMVMAGVPDARLATAGNVELIVLIVWQLAQILTVALNNKRRAIHDYIAGSVVVRLDVQEVELGEPQEAAVRPWVTRFERLGRPGMAGLGATAAALTSLVFPTALLLMSGGEICPGYRTDVGGYYLKLVPLALVAAMVGAVVGAAIGWPRPLFYRDERLGWGLGFGLVAVIIGGVVLAIISCLLAVYPGC